MYASVDKYTVSYVSTIHSSVPNFVPEMCMFSQRTSNCFHSSLSCWSSGIMSGGPAGASLLHLLLLLTPLLPTPLPELLQLYNMTLQISWFYPCSAGVLSIIIHAIPVFILVITLLLLLFQVPYMCASCYSTDNMFTFPGAALLVICTYCCPTWCPINNFSNPATALLTVHLLLLLPYLYIAPLVMLLPHLPFICYETAALLVYYSPASAAALLTIHLLLLLPYVCITPLLMLLPYLPFICYYCCPTCVLFLSSAAALLTIHLLLLLPHLCITSLLMLLPYLPFICYYCCPTYHSSVTTAVLLTIHLLLLLPYLPFICYYCCPTCV